MTCTLTDTLSVTANLGEVVEVTSYADRVVVEVAEGRDCINAHLTIAQAEQHVAHMLAQIEAAKRLGARAWVRLVR
jgi:hypothetical protein